jgi:serine phosphatase RsbU (regulator of sigma subunit)
LVNVWYGDKKPITYQAANRTKAGEKIWVQTTLTPILNDENQIERLIAIDSDITRLKEAEEEIVRKSQDITSSIAYAKRIQEAMITPFSILTRNFPNSFKYYQPKSIVSGDFYWMTEIQNKIIIACADGTGHGVPGAFISLIGISFLNKIVNEKGFINPSVILNRLRMNIINHLRQTDNETVAGDGIDMSIICIDKKNNSLEYAGAMNPIYIIREGNFIELKPDRMPVGFFDNENRPFSSTSFATKKDDQIYMFTDGYYDQFGGENGSKLKNQRFKEILSKTIGLPTTEQMKIVNDEFLLWKNEYSQVDDVLVMGIRMD